MSASLVGSEMCIRDSCSPLRFSALLAGGAAASPPPVLVGWLGGRGGRQPVSYTHLTLPTICSV
eukprot:14308945-Alexandrium_andersonii.AAC.1